MITSSMALGGVSFKKVKNHCSSPPFAVQEVTFFPDLSLYATLSTKQVKKTSFQGLETQCV